ncbi:FHF complex subunit HOOK-interacting protein 1B-like isoform X2 [Watersipora subatra]|uniref:FHF complex subunit HOOK-interacting protein 1B-like isoform X2 n=1 Tax=Watersipora subatra TaxID=2589382 RepID=UPI00355C4E67
MDILRMKLRGKAKQPDEAKNSTTNGKLVTSLPSELTADAFRNHWKQSLAVIKRTESGDGKGALTVDGVSTVIHNIEKMSDFLSSEEEENGQQGRCLDYLLAEDILEQLVRWCLTSGVYENKIKYELLKILESLIGQSSQPLLYHKPVIKPLLALLGSCMNTTLPEIENHVILLLHQLCVCISRNPQYLELFFNVSYLSGQNNFLIFCLLIPYIHREGSLGQQARDALLLIMAASARNQVIGKYIASNSDFCPVLATGLSGLYSSLPHKIRPEGLEDWYRIEKELYLDMPDVQMIINCLEFCNAVVQVAHELVGEQLIEYIYNGFLLPVMAPALIQNSIEEQVSAIAYLELFIRTVTEPSLLRAFLQFILTTKHDEVILLDWLIDRISSSTKLCMVSLSLFKTLVELDCEDVMFSLCFKYLYRMTHIMQSQKRAIKQLDIYGNIADKLLQLEPSCCQKALSEEQQRLLISYNDGIFSSGHTPTPTHLDEYKSSYMDYLVEAKEAIQSCSKYCSTWCYVYDGEIPPYNASLETISCSSKNRSSSTSSTHKCDTPDWKEEDDVPLLQLSASPVTSTPRKHERGQPSASEEEPDVSLLINLDPEPELPVTTCLLSDDVPLCIDDVPSPKYNQTDLARDETEGALLVLDAHSHDNTTLNMLLQAQNKPVAALLSPPLYVTESSPVAVADAPLTSPLASSLQSDNFESFLSYLDNSVEHLTIDSGKPEQVLFEEIETVIKDAEVRVNERNESRALADIAGEHIQPISDPGQNLDTGQHLVDSQNSGSTDRRTRKKISLSLDDSIDSTPSIGPFLTTLLNKLENMMNNSLSVNLLLTGLVTRIAAYPQPLLRSFLLNHSLVFQPTIKSLIQVLSVVREKVDKYAEKTSNFNVLLLQARKIMMDRADGMESDLDSSDGRQRSASVMSHTIETDNGRSPGRRLTDFFRRDKNSKQNIQPELVLESNGYRFTNIKQSEKTKFESAESRLATINTKKAVYCALVMEEFVKELAALSQEHAIRSDEGYQTE